MCYNNIMYILTAVTPYLNNVRSAETRVARGHREYIIRVNTFSGQYLDEHRKGYTLSRDDRLAAVATPRDSYHIVHNVFVGRENKTEMQI